MAAKRGRFCGRGHDTTLPGALNSQGRCKECVKIVARERRAAIRAGTYQWRNPVCKHGHHMRIVGISPNGGCKECHRIRARKVTRKNRQLGIHRPVEHRKPICPRGHDKRIVGVSDTGSCYRCYLDALAASSMRKRRRAAGFDGDPQKVPQLKAIRLRYGMTAAEMAGRIGISAGHYSSLENGRKTASRKVLAQIVRVTAYLMHTKPAGEGSARRGRYTRVLLAIAEAERRGHGFASAEEIGRILDERGTAFGVILKYAQVYGFAERYENGKGPVWLLTEKGRELIGEKIA